MASKNWGIALAGVWLLAACGDSSNPSGPILGPGPDGSTDAPADDDAGQIGDGDDSKPPPSDKPSIPEEEDAAIDQPYDYHMEDVALTADLVIPKGVTVRVGPGVKFSASSSSIKVDVFGKLVVAGTAESPSSFLGKGSPKSWHGIVVQDGGSLTLEHVHIGGAQYGLFAMPGSAFSVDHAVIDTSFKAAVVQSNGRFTNSVFTAVPLFPAITDEVSIDDPNGCLTIMDASPTVMNCRFDGSGGLNDMIRIGGSSSPVFDHIYVHASHCGFHVSGGTNNSPRIKNSILEGLAYGIMAYTSKAIFEDSVFRRNSTDVGICSGATKENAPSLSGNFFEGGALKLDASCDRIGTKDIAPAAKANPSAGTSGL